MVYCTLQSIKFYKVVDVSMKLRNGFVANSSSTSFVLLVDIKDGGAKLTIPNITTINLSKLYDLYDNDDYDNSQYSYYRYNWTPTSLQDCIDESINYLKKSWIRRLMFNHELSETVSVKEYAIKCAETILSYSLHNNAKDDSVYTYDNLVKYFSNEFDYIANTYDLLVRMLNDYWDNFLLPKSINLQERLLKYKNWHLNEFYKEIMDRDNKEGFSFQQYVCNFSIHNKGIYMVNPISYEHNYVVLDTKIKDTSILDKNGIMWYNRIIGEITRIKKLLITYLYCHFTGNVLQNMIIGDGGSGDASEINDMILSIYDNTKFVRPIANFDVIDVARE